MTEIGTEQDVGQAVGEPLEAEVGVDVLIPVRALILGIRELAGSRWKEHLVVGSALGIAVTAAVANVATHLQEACSVFRFAILPSESDAAHRAGGNAVAASTPSATKVVHIVAAANDGQELVVHEAIDVELCRIAVFRTVGAIDVAYPSLLHAFLDSKVEHGFLLAIINAGDAAVVALLVVGFEFLDELRRQVLHCHLRVVLEELLAIDHNLGDALAVYLDVAIIVNFCSGQFLDEFVQHRAFGQAVGIGIEDEGIGTHLHLSQLCRHLGFLQHLAVLLHGNGAKVDALVAFWQNDIAVIGLETHEADAQDIVTRLDGRQFELALEVGRDASRLGAVLGLKQYNRRTGHRLVLCSVHHKSAYRNFLCHCHKRTKAEYKKGRKSFHLGINCVTD